MALPSEAHSLAEPAWIEQATKNHLVTTKHLDENDHWEIVFYSIHVSRTADGTLATKHKKLWRKISAGKSALTFDVRYDNELQTLITPEVIYKQKKSWRQLKNKGHTFEVSDIKTGLVDGDRRYIVTTKPLPQNSLVAASWQVSDLHEFPGQRIFVPLDDRPIAKYVITSGEDTLLINNQHEVVDRFEMGPVPSVGSVYAENNSWQPSPLEILPYIVASPSPKNSWAQIAQKVADLFKEAVDYENSDIEMRDVVGAHAQQRSKIAASAAFAQQLAYRNIFFGIGAYQPATPYETLRTMSADCKGKTALLHVALRTLDVPSVPVLARIHQRYLNYDGPPASNIFNHMVLAIDATYFPNSAATFPSPDGKRWVLFDATDPLALLGSTPRGLQGTQALWLGENPDFFVFDFRAPQKTKAELSFTVLRTGDAQFVLTISGASDLINAARKNVVDGTVTKGFLENLAKIWRRDIPGLQVTSVTFTSPNQIERSQSQVVVTGTVERALQTIRPKLYQTRAPTSLLRTALGFSGASLKHLVGQDSTEHQWKAPNCCPTVEGAIEAKLNLTLPNGLIIRKFPKIEPISAPWLKATSQSNGYTWQMSAISHSGDFLESTLNQRVSDINSVISAMKQSILLTDAPTE